MIKLDQIENFLRRGYCDDNLDCDSCHYQGCDDNFDCQLRRVDDCLPLEKNHGFDGRAIEILEIDLTVLKGETMKPIKEEKDVLDIEKIKQEAITNGITSQIRGRLGRMEAILKSVSALNPIDLENNLKKIEGFIADIRLLKAEL